jgi:ATP-dependent Clp protease ATP-binding subunit ClpA
MLTDFDGIPVQILKALDIKVGDLSQKIDEALSKHPKVTELADRQLSIELQKALKQAFAQAKSYNDEYISREHILLALMDTDCQASYILNLYPKISLINFGAVEKPMK